MVKIVIPLWDDCLPRKSYLSLPWIKLPSKTFRHRKLHMATISTRWTYIAVMCIVADEAGVAGWLEAPIEWWAAQTHSADIVGDLQFLSEAGLILLENFDLKHLRSTQVYLPSTDVYSSSTDVYSPSALEKRREEKKNREEKTERKREGVVGGEGLPVDNPVANKSRSRSRSKAVQVMDLSDAELELGTDWLKLAVTHFPHKATDPKWNPSEFAFELRKVANVIGLSIAQMRDLLEWVKADTFWCNKVASPYGLLKKSTNGLRKIENALASSKSKAQIKNAQIQADWEENPEKKKAYELAMSIMRGGRP